MGHKMNQKYAKYYIVSIAFATIVAFTINVIIPNSYIKPGDKMTVAPTDWTSLDQIFCVDTDEYKNFSYTLYRIVTLDGDRESEYKIPLSSFEKNDRYEKDGEMICAGFSGTKTTYLEVQNLSGEALPFKYHLYP